MFAAAEYGGTGARMVTGPSEGMPGVISGKTSMAATRIVSKKREIESDFLRNPRARFIASGSLSIMQFDKVPSSLMDTHLLREFIRSQKCLRGGGLGMAYSCYFAPPLVGPGVRAISTVIDTGRAAWFPRPLHLCRNANSSLRGVPKMLNFGGLQIFRT